MSRIRILPGNEPFPRWGRKELETTEPTFTFTELCKGTKGRQKRSYVSIVCLVRTTDTRGGAWAPPARPLRGVPAPPAPQRGSRAGAPREEAAQLRQDREGGNAAPGAGRPPRLIPPWPWRRYLSPWRLARSVALPQPRAAGPSAPESWLLVTFSVRSPWPPC